MQRFELILAFSNKIPDMHLFQGKIDSTGILVLEIFAFAFLIFVLFAILNYWKAKRLESLPASYGDANQLLDFIADIAGLGISDRWILRKLAKEMKIAQPSAFLLSPELLIQANEFWVKSHKLASTKAWGTYRLNFIATQIFGLPISKL